METITTKHLKDELIVPAGYRMFTTTLNSRGKLRIAICKGEDLTNKNSGVLLYEGIFRSWRRIPVSVLKEMQQAIDGSREQ